MPDLGDIPEGHQAKLGDGTQISATQGVFPILHEIEEGKLQVIGTGFFITRYGLFLSARHVFDDFIESDEASRKSLRIFHHTGEHIHIRHILSISYNNVADIVVGYADNFATKLPQNPLSNIRAALTLDCPKPREKLVTFAYPRNFLLDFSTGDDPIHIFADQFRGEFVSLEQPSKYDEHGVELYQTSVPVEGGASGGPFFNQTGQVVGIARSSLEFKGSDHDGATSSLITPIRHCLGITVSPSYAPEISWEFQQIPPGSRATDLSIEELSTLGHLLLENSST